MSTLEPSAPVVDLRRIQRGALITGGLGVLLCALGAILSLEQFFHAYLWAYLFWFGLALGCFGVTKLQHLAGGRWSVIIRRPLESGTMTLPVMTPLVVPQLSLLP